MRQLLRAFPADAAATDAELALVFALVRLLDGALERSAAYVEVADRLAGHGCRVSAGRASTCCGPC